MSKDLKSRGFTFVGSTIIYAHMQAVGMVNDHVVECFAIARLRSSVDAERACLRPPSESRLLS
jgi:DNA-3-methyladenine glycosylase I